MTDHGNSALAAILFAAVVGAALTFAPWPTRADPKPGIWQESTFDMQGVAVVRFRDTTHGSNNVCYFARRVQGGYSDRNPSHDSVAISCVRDPQ